ncbi:glycosyltransferase family 2 protein [Komagataeibacter rhaeticus]|nr:glycosyltransferase family 2 protein [Komagataeibacter rhaeticus]
MPPVRFTAPTPVVAIPVRNEAERIAACLHALAGQQGARLAHAVLLLNNCTDATRDMLPALAPHLPFVVHGVERTYPAPLPMRARALRSHGNCRVPGGAGRRDPDNRCRWHRGPDWLANTLAAFEEGADAVCGRALINPADAALIPMHLHEDDRMETGYGMLLDRIHDLVDPDPHDPWPRHAEHSGASIAVSVVMWRRAGGLPPLPLGEDRAFLKAVRRVDGVIRHAPDVLVTVSGRTLGRARGGMADTMARRLLRQDDLLDESLEPALTCLRRARARAVPAAAARPAPHVRAMGVEMCGLAYQLDLPPAEVERMARAHFLGVAWDSLEQASPALVRVPVRRAELATHHRQARRVVRQLLARRSATRTAHRHRQPVN